MLRGVMGAHEPRERMEKDERRCYTNLRRCSLFPRRARACGAVMGEACAVHAIEYIEHNYASERKENIQFPQPSGVNY